MSYPEINTSIIIVNYNVSNEVDNCLNSIYLYFKKFDFEVIVIDNNSTDRDIENLRDKYRNVRFEFLSENLGFGKANNYGISISKGKYILLLNPDTLIIEDFVSPIIEFAENNSNAGACGPMLVYKDLTFQNSFGNRMGLVYEMAEALMFIELYRKLYRYRRRKNIIGGKVMRVGWLSGACILVNSELIKRVNGFDEKYFLNYEDIDLCRRIEELNCHNYYFPAYKCVHIDHSSQNKNYERLVFTRYQSRRIYAEKHYHPLKKLVIAALHIIGLVLRILTVSLFYSGSEKKLRYNGYKMSLKLYLK